jgi:hypothetical protein
MYGAGEMAFFHSSISAMQFGATRGRSAGSKPRVPMRDTFSDNFISKVPVMQSGAIEGD